MTSTTPSASCSSSAICCCCSEIVENNWEYIDGFSVCPFCGYVNESSNLSMDPQPGPSAISSNNPYNNSNSGNNASSNKNFRAQRQKNGSFRLPRRCLQVMDALKIPKFSPFRSQVFELAERALAYPTFRQKKRLFQLFIFSCIYAVACKEGKNINIKDISVSKSK